MRYAIIGSSAAGVQAAEDLRRLDPESEIIVVSKAKYQPYSRCLISRFVDGRLTEENLYFKTKHFFKDYNIRGILNTPIVKIDKAKKKVITQDDKALNYDKLLVATGARTWLPKVPGLDLDGVYCFHNLDDAYHIIKKVRRSKEAVVVGTGFVGLEAAYSLSKLGLKVTVIEQCSQILPNLLDNTAARIIQKDLEELGPEIVLNESLMAINGDTSVCDVSLADKSHIKCGMVVMATGIQPNMELVKEEGIETDAGILVDEFLNTSEPDIYAAGDVIEIQDVSTGKRTPSATWFNAVLQGKFAAYNMAGKRYRYTKAVGIQNAVQFHQIPAISYGQTIVDSTSHEAYEVMSIHKGTVYKKLILRDGKIHGMIFVGDISKSGFYAALIREGIDISDFEDKLLDEDFGYAYLKEEDFGQRSPYRKTSPCWESSRWRVEQGACWGI